MISNEFRIRCKLNNYIGELCVSPYAERPTIIYKGKAVPCRIYDIRGNTITVHIVRDRGPLVTHPGDYARKVLVLWKSKQFRVAHFERWDPKQACWYVIDQKDIWQT